MEQWLDVVGFEGIYQVSNFGRIRSIKTGKIKEQTIHNNDNRPYLGLWKNNKQKICRPHKLVMEAFVGIRPQGMECCHNDGNPLNCKLENLRWDTKSNNHKDKKKHGTWQVGEKANNVKLNNKIVFDIRNRKLTASQAAKEYGLSKTNAKRIVNFETWKHL